MSLFPHVSRVSPLSLFWKSLPLLTALLLAWSLGYCPTAARAADAPADKKTEDTEPKEPPAPEDLDLTTEDGLGLKGTYFPGMKGQESIPVIIIHGLDATNNSKEFAQDNGLAAFLQSQLGCAVVVPDLRGHGLSVTTTDKKLSHFPPKKQQEMLRLQHAAMVQQDLRAVKDFLWTTNNEKKPEKALNIDKLVVIGVDGGAALAISYADDDSKGYKNGDWQYGKSIKLGRFVKAVILISPEISKVTGLNAAQAIAANPVISKDVQIMIVSGSQSKNIGEATSLRNRLVNLRPKLAAGAAATDSTIWPYLKIETKLQGTKLLDETSLQIPDKIKNFITARVVKNPDVKEWAWKPRKLPHQD